MLLLKNSIEIKEQDLQNLEFIKKFQIAHQDFVQQWNFHRSSWVYEMLRFLLIGTLIGSTFALGLWAYKINYDSRAAEQRVKELEKSILSANKQFKILNAEWAHLNRPDRLRKLAGYYFSELRLTPINPDDFISFSDVYWGQFSENESTALVDKRLTGITHEE